MYCPSCGLNDSNSNQFCRACGTNLAPVRTAVERTDNVTQSAVTARDEIGRAIAARIRQTQTAKDLKVVAEEVLPEIEKFLESPEEKRLRRLRSGIITGSIGLGVALAFGIISAFRDKEEFLMLAALGLVTFFIGLSFFINAMFASIPRKSFDDRSPDADRQRELDGNANDLALPEARQQFVSVVEDTTRNLTKR
ncbi:MAG: zinc ribbon domain-containing protein [Acidobacteria bacterium]|nr:zinc ribbon domain-containing protein [Acidobacteriota bacterium]MBK8149662.1 zinc ribbon domain-containing protein [Acidobacteriota bacterium]MBK8809784.1 zinc ribbon domain-containing protein [Acidobacteriota bacterium]